MKTAIKKIFSIVTMLMLLGSNLAFINIAQATIEPQPAVPDYLSCPFEPGDGKTIVNFNTDSKLLATD